MIALRRQAATGALLLLIGSAASKDCTGADVKFDELWIDPACDGKLDLYGSNLGDAGTRVCLPRPLSRAS